MVESKRDTLNGWVKTGHTECGTGTWQQTHDVVHDAAARSVAWGQSRTVFFLLAFIKECIIVLNMRIQMDLGPFNSNGSQDFLIQMDLLFLQSILSWIRAPSRRSYLLANLNRTLSLPGMEAVQHASTYWLGASFWCNGQKSTCSVVWWLGLSHGMVIVEHVSRDWLYVWLHLSHSRACIEGLVVCMMHVWSVVWVQATVEHVWSVVWV